MGQHRPRRARLGFGLVLVAALAVVLVVLALDSPRQVPYTTDARVDGWLRTHEGAYVRSVAQARRWLEPLRVDPAELRAHGIKGRKKLVELIDGWVRLYRIADEADRPAILRHIDDIAAITRTDRYHDMLTVDDQTFKQDATSYLRAAYLLGQLDLDIDRYRAEIERIHPRLNAHMSSRGPHQQYIFHVYYGWFGLAEPFPLVLGLEDGHIADRTDPAAMNRDDVYSFTHEIFGPYDYGDDLDVQPFGPDDLRYIRSALSELVPAWIRRRDPDLVAELVSCARYVRAIDLPVYTEGLDFLLRSQAPDGHWGDYAPEAEVHGAFVATYKLELHTTTVALDALTVAFHRPWNQRLVPVVP